jgi:hypothetical protein
MKRTKGMLKPGTPKYEAARAKLEKRVNDALHASVQPIEQIAVRDGIAVLMLNPCSEWQVAAKSLGWDGCSPRWEMSHRAAEEFAANSKQQGDVLTARWLQRRRGPARVFVFVDDGTLLVNFTEERSWHLEPGSLDNEFFD